MPFWLIIDLAKMISPSELSRRFVTRTSTDFWRRQRCERSNKQQPDRYGNLPFESQPQADRKLPKATSTPSPSPPAESARESPKKTFIFHLTRENCSV